MVDKKEQEMREEIASYHSRKDYYEILGISRQASDSEIKKAYRALALRFHPDKNQYEGAKEVFKKVSNAYSTLIDAQKKAHYDRFGPEEDRPRPQYRQANQQDYEFEQYDDIFRAFFGGMHMHGGRRRGNVYTYGAGANPQQQQAQARQANFGFYVVFLLFFLIYAVAPFFESRPNYSIFPSNEYKYRARTPQLNVEYYVNQKFFEEAKNPKYKQTTEMIIDREYIAALEKQCEGAKRDKRRLEEFAYRERGERKEYYLRQAGTINMFPCKNIHSLHERYQDYLRDLAYMR